VRQALISDVHGNLEALTAVMADIATQSIDQIACLGDVVGYGPNPCECLDVVMSRCEFTIMGNHDQATLFDPEGFNQVALRAIYWTRDALDRGTGTASQSTKRWDFLGELPRWYQNGEILYVHGSPRDPTNEYVFPETIYDQKRMELLFDRLQKYCFQGHTHMPGIFTNEPEFITPDDCGHEFPLGREKLMVNVGSVGQPRDEDPRSCYTIIDHSKKMVYFRRVQYDFETTIRKIYAIEELDNMLGDRLRTGR
jgi:predicted phosphodiesterase